MKDNLLKKTFETKDVSRLRNILKGKSHKKTYSSVGYSKKEIVREEGEIWEEDGRTWTIKKGLKQNISKLKHKNFPLFCPKCKNKMVIHDKGFYHQYGWCLNCQAEFETQLKINKKWDIHKNQIINEDIDNLIKDYSNWIDEEIKKTSTPNITEAGEEEKWVGNIKNKLLKDKEETLSYLKSLRK